MLERMRKSEDGIPWRDAFKEMFGDESHASVNLRGLRYREDMTQAQLGKALGIGQSNVSKFERGKRLITRKLLNPWRNFSILIIACFSKKLFINILEVV